MAALLIVGFGIFLDRNFLFADSIDQSQSSRTTCYDEAGDCSNTLTDSDTAADSTVCPGCPGNNVIITNTTFRSGTNCICVGYESITIQAGVTIKSGATVIFSAPTVILQSGFQAEPGSVVNIETEEPPPPPG